MSLINQMLQDLEKRRASAAERGAMPNQVRVLPAAEKTPLRVWMAIGGIALAVLAAWQYWLARNPADPLRTPSGSGQVEAGPEVSSSAVSAESPSAKYLADGPASRLTLDLAVVPASTPHVAARPPAVTQSGSAAGAVAPSGVQGGALPASSVIATEAPAAPLAGPAKVLAPPPDTKAVPPVAAVPAQAAASKPRTADAGGESRPPLAVAGAQIDKRMQTLTPAQMAENEYREAANFLGQGRLVEAQDGFRQALQHNPMHVGARQGLFGLLVDARRTAEAEQLLKEGLKLNPGQPGLAMALARLQLDRADANAAIETLQASAASAQNSPDYLAFFAGLLQRQSRHREAVEQYQTALRLAPNAGVWLMGLGISLQALGRNTEAQDAFRRARASNTLNAELQAFVDQRLRQLQ